MRKLHIALIALALAACKKEEQAATPVYQAVPVVRRDIADLAAYLGDTFPAGPAGGPRSIS